ncbi:uncharacterized protein [Elaeis guineensis]|uniref:uncharacterized protein isoform X2 n=2 Tax=Elaeis guineensis var. tenera TaxID=51953 RepID=UPI003C6CE8E3
MDTAIGARRSSAFRMENPFSLKVFQVFTGFGAGCGIGIGVGRPIYLGAIPVLQQVMSATRGATDAFSGVGRHLKKLGMKNIEAGIGCGVGVGHGFGVGLALKPGVVHLIQSSLEQMMSKIMMNVGSVPGLSSAPSIIPGSAQSSITMLNGTFDKKVQSSSGSVLDLESETTGSTFQHARFDESPHQEPTHNSYESNRTMSEKSIGSHTEKVINNFLQNPLFRNDEEMGLNEVDKSSVVILEINVINLCRGCNIIRPMLFCRLGIYDQKITCYKLVIFIFPCGLISASSIYPAFFCNQLLKHQQVIEELMEENQKLRQILMEDLNVPPSKLQTNKESKIKTYYTCSDCFECRRRNRRRTR